MKFIDWFAGIGGFRKGMEDAGHECVGFCEFDKFAVASYTAMHLCTQEQFDYLATLPFKQRQKEILKEKYRNGEWYADDVRSVDARSIPRADCWCFGFPCQDISTNGKRKGFRGSRSSLFFRVMQLLEQIPEEEKPAYLFIENVKNLLSVNTGWDFARLLIEMDNAGYDAEWSVLNSKDFGVPQNRERCFIIGHLRDKRGPEIFPLEGTSGKIDIPVSHRNYSDSGVTVRIKNSTKLGYLVARENVDSINLTRPESQSRRGRVGVDRANTIDTSCEQGIMIRASEGMENQAIWDEEHNCYIAIRKFTPKESFRLQGWSDDYFEKASLVNGDQQLYKQAGNGVTVNVIRAIAERMT